jgi:hypothetical protein
VCYTGKIIFTNQMKNFSVYYPDVRDSRAVFVVVLFGRSARPRTQHDCHNDTKVKPKAASAVIELLIMGGKTPEAC